MLNTYKNRVKDMFYHAYNNYIQHAYPYDELKPITCTGFDTWGSYSLTLIDSLDFLIILGNRTEFERVVELLTRNLNFNKDINVSVFETNIRIIGGLLSAHLLSYRLYMEPNSISLDVSASLGDGWPCDGPLLRMAVAVADKILPAFNTSTGMPYGTVNLAKGVPVGETPETCAAGVGTFLIEFATLSRLTGNPIYERHALKALESLWHFRSPINLPGNHINVETGKWTGADATIGSGVDSYFEYLLKGGILLNRPDLIEQFRAYQRSIDRFLASQDHWYFWSNMNKGQKTLALFSSLEAFYPGLLILAGDVDAAIKNVHNYHHLWRRYGSLPEFFNLQSNDVQANREGYPLRPELIESLMYVLRATGYDKQYLEMAVDYLEAIDRISRLDCGFATVKDVRDHRLDDRMESFFLAETLKYLYLIFDSDNFLHNDLNSNSFKLIRNKRGECLMETGFFVFNTEAHPIDGAALDCCISMRQTKHDLAHLDVTQLIEKHSQQKQQQQAKMEKSMREEFTELVEENREKRMAEEAQVKEMCTQWRNSPLSMELNSYKEKLETGHSYPFTCSMNHTFRLHVSHFNSFSYYP